MPWLSKATHEYYCIIISHCAIPGTGSTAVREGWQSLSVSLLQKKCLWLQQHCLWIRSNCLQLQTKCLCTQRYTETHCLTQRHRQPTHRETVCGNEEAVCGHKECVADTMKQSVVMKKLSVVKKNHFVYEETAGGFGDTIRGAGVTDDCDQYWGGTLCHAVLWWGRRLCLYHTVAQLWCGVVWCGRRPCCAELSWAVAVLYCGLWGLCCAILKLFCAMISRRLAVV